ncbi:MAG: MFS transporter [Betaproteobacteria bacterium]|nr:MFS transporter [Betaproteobacteria bacterium]
MPGPGPQLVPFAALSASYFAHIGFFNPYLPLWLKDLGFGLFAISLLTSVQAATRLFAPYVWGVISDRTGERVKLLRYSATVAFVVSLALMFQLAPWTLGIVLFVMFTHTSSMMPMSEAAMAHLVTREGGFDARRYGRVRLWGSVGFLVTVFAAGSWFEVFGMGHFPAWTALTMGAVLISVWRLPDAKESAHAGEPHVSVWPVLRQPAIYWFFVSLFFHVLAHISVYVYFSLYLDELGYSKTIIGLMWAVGVCVEIAWFYTQGRWLPRWSLPTWLVICAGAMAVRMGLTAALGGVVFFLILAQMLHGLSFAAHHTVCVSLLSAHFPGRLRGRGQALFTVIGYGLTGVFGGFAGGWISSKLGLSSAYWSSLAISLMAILAALNTRRLLQTGSQAN